MTNVDGAWTPFTVVPPLWKAGKKGNRFWGKPSVGFVRASRRPSSSEVRLTSTDFRLSSSCASLRAPVLAAQRSALQRRPRGDAEPELARHRHELLFDGALEKGVLDLETDECGPAAEARRHVRLGDLPGGRVRDAEVADLSCAHEAIEGGHGLFDRRVNVPVVKPVQVDVV